MSSGTPVSRAKQLRDADALARKRMRKGTRSCLQCRSRKVRCIYPPNSRICHGCLTHGRDCTEQTYQDVKTGGLDKRVGLKERVRELEGLVQQLVARGGADAKELEQRLRKGKDSDFNEGFLSPPDSTESKDGSPSEHPAEYHGVDEDSDSYDEFEDDREHPNEERADFQKAPIMSLLNNDLLQTSNETTFPIRSGPAKPLTGAKAARQAKIVEELRSLVPPVEGVKALLEKNQEMLLVFQELIFHSKLITHHDVHSKLDELLKSDRPIDLVKAVLFFTAIVQQSDPDSFRDHPEMFHGLSAVAFIHKNSDAVEQHLCSSNSMIGSLDGLEASVMLSKIQFNDGRPRKSWLLVQRSLSYCRLLGFHHGTSWKTPHNPMIGDRRQLVWWHHIFSDRALSLLLGLPYSIATTHITKEANLILNSPPRQVPEVGLNMVVISMWLQLALISGRIVDRNQDQERDMTTSFAESMKIDGELHALQHTMSKEWWALSEDTSELSNFADMPASKMLESSMIQTWSHECRIALHMPFMMRSAQESTKGQYDYSRVTATNSARAMIRCHLRVRARPDMASMVCQVVDFQVFNAAVLIILDMLLRSRGQGKSFWENIDDETKQDLAMIKDTYWMLRNNAQKCIARANVPAQAIKVLETLGYLVRGCAVPGLDKHNRRIVIPYFGAITIRPSTALQEQVRAIPQDPNCGNMEEPDHNHMYACGIPPKRPTSILTPSSMSSFDLSPSQTHGGSSSGAVSSSGAEFSCDPSTFSSPDNSAGAPQQPLQQPANDFTFNAFSAPQEFVNFMPSCPDDGDSISSMLPGSASVPLYGAADSLEGYLPSTAEDGFDTQMWDDGQWQQMLLDPGLDLDNANWGFFPVEGTA